MTELSCRAWGRAARTGWRCRREGWRPGLGCLTWAPFRGVGGLDRAGVAVVRSGCRRDGWTWVPGQPRRRGDRTGAGTPGDKTDSAPPGPRRAGPRGWLRGACGTAGPARLNGPAARQAQHGNDPVTLTPYAGRGVQQRVIRTLEGGGGGRGRGGGAGDPGSRNNVTPQQGLPHTDIAPPLTHRLVRPTRSASLAPCPDGPPSPHRPDPAPNVSAPSHEAHRPHRRPQTAVQSPADAHRPSLPAGHRRFAAPDRPGNELRPTEPATGSNCPEPRPTQVCQPYGPAHPRPPHLGAPGTGPGPVRANRADTRPSHIRPGSTAALLRTADRAVPRAEPLWVSA